MTKNSKNDVEDASICPLFIDELSSPELIIKEGLVSKGLDTVIIKRNGLTIGRVILSEPLIVAQAEKEEPWGFFQFPSLYRNEKGNLIVEWQMMEDSYKSYGKGGDGRMMSDDEGKTWRELDYPYERKSGHVVDLYEGGFLRVTAQPSRSIGDYSCFPKPVLNTAITNATGSVFFYRESELPDDLRGNYIIYHDNRTNSSKVIHGTLDDPGLLRYAINGMMPVLWLGDIKEIAPSKLIAGIFPAYYMNSEGKVLHSGISFYQSDDKGYTWKRIGTIPYIINKDADSIIFNGDEGFSEPTFAILKNGTYLCVARTGFFSPMYKSISCDCGCNWSVPTAISSNGVSPELLQLENGVLVLSSGRPGIQIRFNMDGDGERWTEPIEMIPFMDENGNYKRNLSSWETCGYTQLMPFDDHTFYIVYSDFKTKNNDGLNRKSILFRKIEVVKAN